MKDKSGHFSVAKLIRVQPALIFFLVGLGLSLNSFAVSISAYRIYMDEDNRETSFVIFNREVESQECNLRLRHNNFDQEGKMTTLPDDVIPANSAVDWIRFSPKKFTLTPSNSQTLRFAMRRRANAEDGEYRSYLTIDCGVEPTPEELAKARVNVRPRLLHNVPIIVRVGKLDAKVSVEDIQVRGDSVQFTIVRVGQRSIYGDVALVNKRTGEKIDFQTGFSIYPEVNHYKLALGRAGVAPEDIVIHFVENENYGGSIVFDKDLSL